MMRQLCSQVCLFFVPVAPSVSSELYQEEEKEEAELVPSVRQLVAERFSSNPAYQLLKARFLSCFTIPALMATIQPVTEKTVALQNGQEEEEEKEEDEEVVELKKIRERGKQRRSKVSPAADEGKQSGERLQCHRLFLLLLKIQQSDTSSL